MGNAQRDGRIACASVSASPEDSLRSDALNSVDLHYIVAVPPPRRHGGFVAGALRVLAQIFSALKLLTQAQMLVLVPMMIYSGLSQTYIFGASVRRCRCAHELFAVAASVTSLTHSRTDSADQRSGILAQHFAVFTPLLLNHSIGE